MERLTVTNPVTGEMKNILVKPEKAARAKSDAVFMNKIAQVVFNLGEPTSLKAKLLVPLTLTEGSETYDLYVSPSDIDRVHRDIFFAAELLEKHKDTINEQALRSLSTSPTIEPNSMLDGSKSMTLEVEDEETGRFHKVNVSSAEHIEARKDPKFRRCLLAAQKLNSMKATTSNIMTPLEESIGNLNNDDDFDNIENPCTSKSQKKRSTTACHWNDNQTQLLLSLYRVHSSELDEGLMLSRTFWGFIVGGLKEKGHSFNLAQCKNKMDSLKKTYKNVKEHNATSGNDKKTCDYYELLDELFHKKPWIRPLSTAGSNIPMEDMDQSEEMQKNKRRRVSMTRHEYMSQNLENERKRQEYTEAYRANAVAYRENKLKFLSDITDIIRNRK